MYESLDNTNHSWSVVEKKITSLGLKFVPTIRRYDSPKKLTDFMKFCRKLRLTVFFHHLHKSSSTVEGNTTGHDNVANHQDQNYSYEDDKKPWDTKLTFNPTLGKSEAPEEFISELEKYLFVPKNIRRVKDNFTREERVCLKRLSQWNKDNNCTKMFRVQDKGSRLVLESKERSKEKMLQYLEDISVFREDGENQSRENEEKVNNWVMK